MTYKIYNLEIKNSNSRNLIMTDFKISKEGFYISTDKRELDIDAIHEFLSTKAYWCLNIPKEKVQNSIEN